MILLAVWGSISAQTSVFVSASASNDNGDGTTWETAKKTIAAGVAAAGANGTVFVKAGTYNTTAEFTVPAGVTVMGGFMTSSAGTDTSLRRRPGTNEHWQNASWCTIVSGAGTHRIATVNGTLDGCVVRYGFTTTTGGGLLIDGGTAQYCVIMWCDAIEEDEFTAEGGGAYIRNNGTLLNCVVTECRGDNGSAVSGEDGSLINNTITRNWPSQCGTVTDFDGNTYHTVQIGSQCWMKENLRTTHYADGTAIPTTSGYSATTPYYRQNPNYSVVTVGLYYNWSAMIHGASSSNANPSGVQGICPTGWHVPSETEWYVLYNFVNGISRFRCNNTNGSIGKAVSAKNNIGCNWSNSTYSCYIGNDPSRNNATRFSAVPAGYLYYSSSSYADITSRAILWVCTNNNNNNNYGKTIFIREEWAQVWPNTDGWTNKQSYIPVRCVKDPE